MIRAADLLQLNPAQLFSEFVRLLTYRRQRPQKMAKSVQIVQKRARVVVTHSAMLRFGGNVFKMSPRLRGMDASEGGWQ